MRSRVFFFSARSLSLSLKTKTNDALQSFVCRDERGFLLLPGGMVSSDEEDKEEVEKSLSTSAPIDLTREEEEKEEKEEEEEEEPQPLAWRLLKRAAEKRCEEKQLRRREDQQTLEAEPTPLEESSFLRNDDDDEEDDDDAQRGRGGGGLGAPLSSPPDYSTKTDQELAKELAKFGMKRLGSRTAMIDCLMNIWTEKMVERGDGAAYSQRLEEELLSLSQRDQNACINNNATNAVVVGMATKKRKNTTTSTLRGGGERTPRTEEEQEQEDALEKTDERALAAKLTAFLKSSRDVYATILRMEPLDLDEVKTLCQNGLRMKCISKVKLAKYFESKGVAVRHNSHNAAKVRKRKKKNTLSSTISPIREEHLQGGI